MKRMIKRVFFLAVIVLSLIFGHPSNAYALTEQTSYVNIDNIENLEIGNLSFSNITFKDYSSTSTQSFGLTGVVVNSSNHSIPYKLTIYYYDSNYNLIAQGFNSGTAISGTNDFNQMSNLSILGKHNVNEIYYYRLSVNISDYASSLETASNITPSKSEKYSSYDYVIDKYNINIIVNENNTFDITETITAYFNVPKHGIIRTIPLKNNITRLDGTSSMNRTEISNLSVDNEYTTSKENDYYKIKIGSASHTLTGEQTYIIKYTYNLGKDYVKDYDELYYNIIGSEWDTVIGNVTFTITMPKEFDSSKLGFSSGTIGSTNNSNIKYMINGNQITGNYDGILGVREALTIRCELPEGYFVRTKNSIDFIMIVYISIPIIFLIISFCLWFIFGRDDKIVETVEFYPPDGLNSLEIGFLYKGEADNTDVISLLIYLANKGFIKIVESDEAFVTDLVSLIKQKKGFKIIKLKDYDGNNENERLFLENLFKTKIIKVDGVGLVKYNNSNGTSIQTIDKQNNLGAIKETQTILSAIKNKNYQVVNIINEVTANDLYDKFYITIQEILKNLNTKENKNKIFEKSSTNKLSIIKMMLILTFVMLGIMIIFNNILVLEFVFVAFLIEYLIFFYSKKVKEKVIGMIMPPLLLLILFVIFKMLFTMDDFNQLKTNFDFSFNPLYIIILVVSFICIIIMRIIYNKMPKRTMYGNQMLGKIKGFKNFLEAAEKDRLEALVMKNPTYCYDILPFAYVLGVSDKWIKKFETISLQSPNWYDSSTLFDMKTFGNFVNSTMLSAQIVMSSDSSSDDSGSDSSGGSSGGGSGGGGGSSW